QQVRTGAHQPVVVRGEVGRHAAGGGDVEQCRAEVVQVVEVHDVGPDAVHDVREGGGDRRVVELALRVAVVEQAVRAVVHADQPDPAVLALAERVGDAGRVGLDRGVE